MTTRATPAFRLAQLSRLSRIALIAAVCAITGALAGGCASGLRDAGGNPVLERATPVEMARAAPPPVPRMTADELVRLSQAGEPPARIIERIRATRTRFGLSASQAIDLSARGVDRSVLDYIVKADQEAARTDAADAIALREAEAARLRAERDQARSQPYYYGPYYPYPRFGGFWGGPGHWRGSLYWGW